MTGDGGGAAEVLVTYFYCLTLCLNLSDVTDSDMTGDGGGATEVLVTYSQVSYSFTVSVFVLISEYQ